MNDEVDTAANSNDDERGRHVTTVSAEYGAFEIFWFDGDLRISGTDFPSEVVPWGEFEPKKIALEFISDPYTFPGYSGMWPGGEPLCIDSEYLTAEDADLLDAIRAGGDAAARYYQEILVNGVALAL